MIKNEFLTEDRRSKLPVADASPSSPSCALSHTEALRALYARLAPAYDHLRSAWSLSLGRRLEVTIDRWILQYLRPSPAVLDLACGTGANLARLLRLGVSPRAYLGIDISPHMLNVAIAKFGHLPFASFRCMDLADADEGLGFFDLVICTYALSHVKDPGEAIDVGLRRLAPHGRAIFAFIRDPGPPLGEMIRPIGRLLAFRPVSLEALRDLRGSKELDRYEGATMTAFVLSLGSHGDETP